MFEGWLGTLSAAEVQKEVEARNNMNARAGMSGLVWPFFAGTGDSFFGGGAAALFPGVIVRGSASGAAFSGGGDGAAAGASVAALFGGGHGAGTSFALGFGPGGVHGGALG